MILDQTNEHNRLFLGNIMVASNQELLKALEIKYIISAINYKCPDISENKNIT